LGSRRREEYQRKIVNLEKYMAISIAFLYLRRPLIKSVNIHLEEEDQIALLMFVSLQMIQDCKRWDSFIIINFKRQVQLRR